MNPKFFEQPILNSPYEAPSRHWELDDNGHPTHRIVEAEVAGGGMAKHEGQADPVRSWPAFAPETLRCGGTRRWVF